MNITNQTKMIKLKGKFKESFEIYYIVRTRKDRPDYNNYSKEQILAKFYRKTLSEQYGVIVDFGIYIGYFIEASISGFYRINDIKPPRTVSIGENANTDKGSFDSKLDEAREQSIIKLQEIYNEQRKDT